MIEYNITITPDPGTPAEVKQRAEFLMDYATKHISRGGLFCDSIFTSAGRVRMHITPDKPELPKTVKRFVGRKLVEMPLPSTANGIASEEMCPGDEI